MSSNTLHVVVGATGGTGSALVQALARQGARVRAVSRGVSGALPASVESVQADALNIASIREACQGAQVVYNCVNPPFAQWHTLFPQVMDNLIAAAGHTGATLVFADDTWMYGPATAPLTEEHPQRPAGPLGALRGQLAATLLDAHRRGAVQAVIGRASELYGPAVESLLAANLFQAALASKRVFWPGALDSPLNPTFIDDFADGLITLGTRAEALGQVWHIPSNSAITGRAFTQLLAEETGTRFRVSALSRKYVALLALIWPVARQGAELIYQFDTPYVVDSSKYQRTFGSTATPYREGIRRTVAWYRQTLESTSTQPDGNWWRRTWRIGSQALKQAKN